MVSVTGKLTVFVWFTDSFHVILLFLLFLVLCVVLLLGIFNYLLFFTFLLLLLLLLVICYFFFYFSLLFLLHLIINSGKSTSSIDRCSAKTHPHSTMFNDWLNFEHVLRRKYHDEAMPQHRTLWLRFMQRACFTQLPVMHPLFLFVRHIHTHTQYVSAFFVWLPLQFSSHNPCYIFQSTTLSSSYSSSSLSSFRLTAS